MLPRYVFMIAKNYMVSRENVQDVKKEEHWIYNSNGRRYLCADGTYVQDTSKEVNGVTYYFNSKGYVRTGWLQEKGQLYHRNPDGTATTGWFEDENGTIVMKMVPQKQAGMIWMEKNTILIMPG